MCQLPVDSLSLNVGEKSAMKGTDIILQLWWYGASTLPVQPTFFRYLLQAGNEPFLLWYLPLSCFLSLHNSLYLSTQHLNTAKTA